MQNDDNVPSVPSTLENIDTAIFRFVDETLNPQVKTNKGIEKVKVLWLGSERAFQIKNNKELRDGVGKLRLPFKTPIIEERQGITLDLLLPKKLFTKRSLSHDLFMCLARSKCLFVPNTNNK